MQSNCIQQNPYKLYDRPLFAELGPFYIVKLLKGTIKHESKKETTVYVINRITALVVHF